jgi:DNA-binding NarL/FixJ family response regulator
MESGQKDIEAVVISEHSLMRLGIETFFAGSRYKIRHEVGSIAKALELAHDRCELVFIGSRLDNEILEPLKSLRQAYPRSRIVFYAQRVELPPPVLIEVFGTSLNGCLLSDAPVEILRQSLDLIMMGEHVFPFSLLLTAFPGDGEAGTHAQPAADQMFSDRERQVLEFLREGRPNKFIARELQLSEATIKVHIKTLLRKIGCTNRTQAAIWVTKHGLLWGHDHHGGEHETAAEAHAGPHSSTSRNS